METERRERLVEHKSIDVGNKMHLHISRTKGHDRFMEEHYNITHLISI